MRGRTTHFGMPTLIEFQSLEQNLELCAELELDFVELNMNLPEYQPDQLDIKKTKKLFEQYGIYPTIHLTENLDVCDFNTAVADAYFDTVIKTIDLAEKLGAPIINMHMSEGIYFTLPNKKIYLFDQYKKQYLERLKMLRDACTAAIGDNDISICIENCGTYHEFQHEGIDLLLESPCFALTYDIGHDFCAGNGNEEFIMSRADRIKHLHIHDATKENCHLPLGVGKIDIFDKIILAQEHQCRSVLEAKTCEALAQSVTYLKKIQNDADDSSEEMVLSQAVNNDSAYKE